VLECARRLRHGDCRGLSPEEPFVENHMWVVVLYDPAGCRIEFESNTLDPEKATLSQIRTAT